MRALKKNITSCASFRGFMEPVMYFGVKHDIQSETEINRNPHPFIFLLMSCLFTFPDYF